MDAAKLAKLCRCGHPRRFHNSGDIMHSFDTGCLMSHHNGPEAHADYRGGSCIYFEAADGWQDSFADALRSEGYLVERVARDDRGRFAPRTAVPE